MDNHNLSVRPSRFAGVMVSEGRLRQNDRGIPVGGSSIFLLIIFHGPVKNKNRAVESY